jgi:uncharacterized protein YdaU (DUF1376 family)
MALPETASASLERVSRIDFDAHKFLLGVAGMRGIDIAVYWVACSLIYADKQPIHVRDERLYRIIKNKRSDIDAAMDRLTSNRFAKEAKLTLNGELIANQRASNELLAAANRISKATINGAQGGRPRNQSERNQQDRKPGGFASQNQAEKLVPLPIPLPIQTTEREEPDLKEVGFEEWWELYPHKVAKLQAREAWEKAITIVSAETLMDATKRYSASKAADVPWMNPGNWLAGERWNDAPASPEQSKPVQTVDFERTRWEARCRGFAASKFWNRDQWGPEPDAPGFRGPRDLVAQTPMPEFLQRTAP